MPHKVFFNSDINKKMNASSLKKKKKKEKRKKKEKKNLTLLRILLRNIFL